MGKRAFDNSGLRGAFRAEVKRSTHATAVAGGLMAIIAMPVWAGFDHLVDPQNATTFTAVRLGLELPLIALWLSLFTTFGRRHPELIMLIFLTLIEASIAFMLSRVEEAYAPYSLGISLAIYAQRLPPDLAVAVHGGAGGAHMAVGGHRDRGGGGPAVRAPAVATIAYYLGTASLVGFLGQYFRQASAWQQFREPGRARARARAQRGAARISSSG